MTGRDEYVKQVWFVWHRHGRPVISVDTPPHVHAHREGDDVEHSHPGLSEVVAIGRWPAPSSSAATTRTPTP